MPKNLLNSFNASTQLRYTFIVIVGLLPSVSLFWDIVVLNIQVNWIIYPILIVSLLLLIVFRRKIALQFLILILVLLFYILIKKLEDGDLILLFRIAFTLIPLTLIQYFDQNDKKLFRLFWTLYLLSMILPLYYIYLQLVGQMPYYTFETVNNQDVGRISGGFNKPTALISFLFPIYIYGFYVISKNKYVLGYLIATGILISVWYIGHRTSTFAFIVIFVASFFKRILHTLITYHYKYFGNFLLGIIGFWLINEAYQYYGLVEALRGRLPMWMLHSFEFWHSSFHEILLGMPSIKLPKIWEENILIWSVDEIHNNTFRTIVFFGLFGYLVYSVFMRSIVLRISRSENDLNRKFILYACFLYHIFFAFTNEQVAYPSIVWPTFIWLFILGENRSNNLQSSKQNNEIS